MKRKLLKMTTFLSIFIPPLLPQPLKGQDFFPEPQAFQLMRYGWVHLIDNPALLAEGVGSYSGYVTGNFPSMSVRTSTGIMGYDGGYELAYRHNSQKSSTIGAITGFDFMTPIGKIGVGLFPAGIRKFNLNLYEFPIGYYDSLPRDTMPYFEWNFNSSGYSVGVGWARRWGHLSLGVSAIYSKITLRMGHLVMWHFNEIDDSLENVPIQFAYVPNYRQFVGSGSFYQLVAGLSLEFGRVQIGGSAIRYGDKYFDGSVLSWTFLPLDTLLAQEIDSSFFSGNVSKVSGVTSRLRFPGRSKYNFFVSVPVGENGKLRFDVSRIIWNHPTTIYMYFPGYVPAVLIEVLDTFNFNLQNTWEGHISFEYRTMSHSIISVGAGYRTPLINSAPYNPLFYGAGQLITADFGFSYQISSDIAVDIRYSFQKNGAFINGSQEVSKDNLAGEYISSNDMLAIGFTYVFPEK